MRYSLMSMVARAGQAGKGSGGGVSVGGGHSSFWGDPEGCGESWGDGARQPPTLPSHHPTLEAAALLSAPVTS